MSGAGEDVNADVCVGCRMSPCVCENCAACNHDPCDCEFIGPLRIPKDPTKRADLYRMGGLSAEEAHAIDLWCATQQREYEARLRRAWERLGDEAMP